MGKDIEELNSSNILVIGDIILDTYIFGSVSRVSPEAPVPVMLKKKMKNELGGAANVAVNLVAAGQKVWLMSVIGDDENASVIRNLLDERGIKQKLTLSHSDRKTTQKTRYITAGGQQMLRVDEEMTDEISVELENEFLSWIEKEMDTFGAIVISDYLKGMVTEKISQKVIEFGKKQGIPVLIDVKDRNITKYKNAFLLKPNRLELKNITQMSTDTHEQIVDAAKKLLKMSACQYILTTLGGDGMLLVSENEVEQFPSVPIEVYDVTGAGDTVIAYLAASIASGMSLREAIVISSYAASLQVSKIGTSAVRLEEVEKFRHNDQYAEGKLITYDDLSGIRNSYKSIVFTNGCFDILHIGHMRYLKEISKFGDTLVVGINSDESVRRLKGEGRPINSISDRIEMLAAYPFIDYIVVFNEDTPIELIKKLKPDILAKGADYKKAEDVVGWDVVTFNGGKVVLVDYTEGKSTSNIVKKIRVMEKLEE